MWGGADGLNLNLNPLLGGDDELEGGVQWMILISYG